ncbi:hypothetical protein C8R44DRAFT_738041 [Mycena epipterygia]|nr:hypothetical protein C8R44DRAFT_738041 [Mycena epipterygia]
MPGERQLVETQTHRSTANAVFIQRTYSPKKSAKEAFTRSRFLSLRISGRAPFLLLVPPEDSISLPVPVLACSSRGRRIANSNFLKAKSKFHRRRIGTACCDVIRRRCERSGFSASNVSSRCHEGDYISPMTAAPHLQCQSTRTCSSFSTMPPLTRQRTFQSIHSWWSDRNLPGATLNLHAASKPLMKLLYHRQVLDFIKTNRGTPLSEESLQIFSDYLAYGTRSC